MDIKLLQAFNKQINFEFYGAYLYFATSTYFDEIYMEDFSKLMKHQASRNLMNAQKIYEYLILRNENLIFSKIDEPKITQKNISEVFFNVLLYEKTSLKQLLKIYELAYNSFDKGAIKFIGAIVRQQQNQVMQFQELNNKIKTSYNSYDFEFLK